jgi:carbon storage regulator CsrA
MKMLVLSRKVNEGVVFSGPGRVVIAEICGNRVRLGFVADKSVQILRDEVHERSIEQEGEDNDSCQ